MALFNNGGSSIKKNKQSKEKQNYYLWFFPKYLLPVFRFNEVIVDKNYG